MLPEAALGKLPSSLRDDLLREFNKVVQNYREERWEPAELDAGRLCEVVYTILRGHVDGSYPAKSSKPRDFKGACDDLAQTPKTAFPHSVRITVPRILIALYDVRNNRGVGHVDGDVDANHMDSVFVLHGSKWVVAELVRIFHDVDTTQAAEIVEALSERIVPLVYDVAGVKRVLNPSLTMKDRSLVLLYSVAAPVAEADLVTWTEHSNASVYRRDVLRRMHKQKLVEYDENAREVHLLPPGAAYVEEQLESFSL